MTALQPQDQADGTTCFGADHLEPDVRQSGEQVLHAAGSMDCPLDHCRAQEGGRLPDAGQGGGSTTAERGGAQGRLAPKRGGAPLQQLLDIGCVETQVARGAAHHAGGQAGRWQVLMAHEDAGGIKVERGQERPAEDGQRVSGPPKMVDVFEYQCGRSRHRLGQFGCEPPEQRLPAHDRAGATPHQLKGRHPERGMLVPDGEENR
jgi:hypothetical protein